MMENIDLSWQGLPKYHLHTELSFPKLCAKEAPVCVAVFVMMPLIFYFFWVIKFISKKRRMMKCDERARAAL